MRAPRRCRTIRPSNRNRKTSMKIHEYQAKEILRKYGVATPRGFPCFSVDEAVKAARELGGKVVDRGTQRVALMASSEGGMDIEEVAAKTPEKIHKVFIDTGTGLKDAEVDGI